MPDYHYKRYINRAFWNSLVAVLCALVVVLIIVYGHQAIRDFLTNLVIDSPTEEKEEMDQLEFLESLKSSEETSEEERGRQLDELQAEAEMEAREEERLEQLETLRQP